MQAAAASYEARDEMGLDALSEMQPVDKTKIPTVGGGLTDTDSLMKQRPSHKRKGQEDEFRDQKKKFGIHHGDSFRLKQLFLNGMAISGTSDEKSQPTNPIWMDLAKCSQPIKTPDEMRKLVDFYAHTDRVMLVRYYQDNCVACNAVEKTYEYLCHESNRHLPELDFYEVHKEGAPDLVKGMVRFPQVKGYSGGQWSDLDFKPHQEFRDSLYKRIGKELDELRAVGEPVTALQAEEMYFSAAGPAMYLVMNDSIRGYYSKQRNRMHNYWKQVSVRRSWFYKKFVEPRVPSEQADAFRAVSIMGERVELGAEPKPEE